MTDAQKLAKDIEKRGLAAITIENLALVHASLSARVPEVVANDELSRQLDHVAFNIMSHSPMTGTEARIVTKAARALESTRSPQLAKEPR